MAERWSNRYDKVPSRDNPYHHRPLGQVATECTAPHGHYPSHPPSEIGSKLNAMYRVMHLMDPKGTPTDPKEEARSNLKGSQPPAPPPPQDAQEDGESHLSSRRSPSELSQASRTSRSTLPSTIRSSQPSTIARKKVAELQLRLELERVKRLELENELENEKRLAFWVSQIPTPRK